MNGRKRHITVDMLGLVSGVVIHPSVIHDGVKAHPLVQHCLGYLDIMRKTLVDNAYKKAFYKWVQENIILLDIEFNPKPPAEKGLVPMKWRWVNERTFGWFNRKGTPCSLENMLRIMKKQLKMLKHGFYGLIANLF